MELKVANTLFCSRFKGCKLFTEVVVGCHQSHNHCLFPGSVLYSDVQQSYTTQLKSRHTVSPQMEHNVMQPGHIVCLSETASIAFKYTMYDHGVPIIVSSSAAVQINLRDEKPYLTQSSCLTGKKGA